MLFYGLIQGVLTVCDLVIATDQLENLRLGKPLILIKKTSSILIKMNTE
jgi:hypothetical protein